MNETKKKLNRRFFILTDSRGDTIGGKITEGVVMCYSIMLIFHAFEQNVNWLYVLLSSILLGVLLYIKVKEFSSEKKLLKTWIDDKNKKKAILICILASIACGGIFSTLCCIGFKYANIKCLVAFTSFLFIEMIISLFDTNVSILYMFNEIHTNKSNN